MLAPVVSKNVQVVADKATNTLVVMAEREDYKILENIIKQLDVPRPMVYIEALIMEVNANKAFNLGVEWRGHDTGGGQKQYSGFYRFRWRGQYNKSGRLQYPRWFN